MTSRPFSKWDKVYTLPAQRSKISNCASGGSDSNNSEGEKDKKIVIVYPSYKYYMLLYIQVTNITLWTSAKTAQKFTYVLVADINNWWLFINRHNFLLLVNLFRHEFVKSMLFCLKQHEGCHQVFIFMKYRSLFSFFSITEWFLWNTLIQNVIIVKSSS